MNAAATTGAVLITGANGSIGGACARMFLERWPTAKVYLGCRLVPRWPSTMLATAKKPKL
jgi:NAD(P)-dependent dehydrogenase (short-subunit alcohol dehydrogenase family)